MKKKSLSYRIIEGHVIEPNKKYVQITIVQPLTPLLRKNEATIMIVQGRALAAKVMKAKSRKKLRSSRWLERNSLNHHKAREP